jgi:hypothetical protein
VDTRRPNLTVATLDTPLQALAASTQPVAWTILNQGAAPTPGGWVDRVYLATNAAGTDGRLLGEFPASGPLGTNQSLPRFQSILIPADLVPDRDYWWVVATDAANAIDESNEINNTRISDQPMRLLRIPTPNLRVASVSASASPKSGQPMTISWAVTNAGTWSTAAGLWQDAVYLSATTNLDGTALPLGRATRPRPLGTNESYASSLTATLPQGLSGTRYFIVQTDADNRVHEGVFENDNTTASAPVAITLTPPPDLQVAAITAPSNALSGTSLAVSWVVTNAGPGLTAESDWADDVYLSLTATLSTNALLLGSFSHAGALTNGQSYPSSASIPLPSSLSGSYYLLVHTDARNQVFEYVFETNNVAVTANPILITLTPPPDLAVSQVTAPATALASHPLSVSCAVTNRGTDTFLTYFWEDRLYLTTNTAAVAAVRSGTLASAAIFSGEPQYTLLHFGGLDAGQAYTDTFTVTLPAALSGPYYAIVETDFGGEVFELLKTNNLRASSAPILIESRPPDLVVSSLTAPSSAQAGSSLLVSWTVRNQGPGDTAVTRWTDRLVLSTDATPGNGDDVTLLTREHNGLLDAGASYTESNEVVTVPFSVAPGSYRLFLLTDSGNTVYEAANEGNNASTPRTVAITRTTADLRVTAVEVRERTGMSALQVLSEDTLLVSWRVENTGLAAPNSTAWSDAIYLSTNSILDTNAVLLGVSQNPVSLAPGTFYTNTLAVTLPAEIQGTFFVHVLADAATEVTEDNKANNTLLATNTLTVTLRPVPDLSVVSVTSPADGYSGQPMDLSWTVTNRGPATAEGTWYDSVYLSQDPQFEPDLDTYIGYAERPTTLTNGQSYTQTARLEIPAEVSGLFYVFVRCDSTDRLNERGATNNNVGRAATPVSVWLRPPADLVLGTINIPTNAVAGYEMALTYVLRNQGTNAAFGPWVDALYFSADDQWDIGDTLFTRVSQTGFLAAGGSRTNTVSAPAPGVLPGNYHVIIRTDIVNQVPETNEFNNITATLKQTAAEVQELALGVTATNQLATRQARYYRVHVTAGQWLVLELNCAAPMAANELFVRYGAIPTRSEFDFTHSNPLQPNHRIVVPDTREGDYYILAYGDFIPAPGSAAFTLTARLSQFLVFDTTFGRGGNAGNLTIPINGVDLDRTCTARLTNGSAGIPAGVNRPAVAHYYESSTRLYATLDLRGLAPGLYTVAVQNGDGSPVTIPDSVEVVEAAAVPSVIPQVSSPSAVGQNRAYTFTVQWANSGLNDAPAPLLTVGNTVPFGLAPGDYSLGTDYTFLGINAHGGPPGIIRPGQVETMTFHAFRGLETITHTAFANRPLRDATSLYDWESLKRHLSAGDLPNGDFERAFLQLIAQTGTTQGDFLAMLSRNCSLLTPSLGDNHDPELGLQIEWNRAIAATGSSISGRIIAPNPRIQFGSVTVSARNSVSGSMAYAAVLQDGSFVFPRVVPGAYEISTSGALLSGGQQAIVAVNVGQAVTNVVLNAGVGATIRGLVYDSTTGQAIRGATLTLLGGTNASAVASSAYDGSFTFAGIGAGSYSLVVEAAGKARKTIQNIALSPDADLTVNLPLLAEARVAGTVVDEFGTPIPSFGVILYPVSTNTSSGFFIAGIAGTFTRNGVEAGTYHTAVSADGYMSHWSSNLTLAAGATLEMPPVVLLRGAVISGRIVDSRASGNAPTIMGAFQNDQLVAAAFIGAGGNYTLAGLPGGTYELRPLLLPGDGIASGAQVSIAAGHTNSAPDCTVLLGATIDGYVSLSAGGGPAQGIAVRLEQPDGATSYSFTATNGYFAFTSLPIGTYHVGLSPAGMFADQTIQVTNVDGRTYRTDFSLGVVACIEGIVRLADTNLLAGASVTLIAGTNEVASAATDTAGRYLILLKSVGVFSLQAHSLYGTFARTGPFEVHAGDTIRRDFTAGTGSLEVGPVMACGTNVAGSTVLLSSVDGSLLATRALHEGERAIFTNLWPATYKVTTIAADTLAAFQYADILASQGVSLQPLLSRQLRLAGSVLGTNGQPVPGATLVVMASSNQSHTLTTLADGTGHYTMEPLAQGDYNLACFAPGYGPVSLLGIHLVTDTAIDLSLPTDGASARGRVVSVAGFAITEAAVTALDSTGLPLGIVLVGSNGVFSIELPTNTPVNLWVSARGFGPCVLPCRLEAEGVTNLSDVTLEPICLAPVPNSGVGQSPALLAGRSPWPAGLVSQHRMRKDDGSIGTWFFDLMSFFANPPRSYSHTDIPLPPADACHLKKCTSHFEDVVGAVGMQNSRYDQAAAIGLEKLAARGEWWSRFTTTAAGAVFATLNYARTLASLKANISLATVAPRDAIIGEAVNLAVSYTASAVSSGLIAAGGAGAVASTTSASDLEAVSRETSAAFVSYGSKTFKALNAIGRARELATSQYAADKPWLFQPNPELIRLTSLMFSTLDYSMKLAKVAEGWFGPMASLASEIKEADWQSTLALESYNQAASEARIRFFGYQACLAAECDPCKEPNPPPYCDKCKQPNPPPECDPCKKPNPPAYCDPCSKPNPPDSCKTNQPPRSYDPNDIVGPGGYGAQYWISPDQTFHYTVRFENDAVKALAPAQYVRITQTLSTNLDLRTFRLGVMGFGTNLVDVSADRVFYQTQVNVTNDLGVVVDIVAGLDLAKGEITWEFTSLDPATGDLPWDPYIGFLPPNTNGIIGQGFVTYTIKPKASIASGDIINAEARIYFDYNEPMDTPRIFNTVDGNLPTSTVLPLPLATNRNIFPLRWAGADAYGGAGISSYTLYVSDNSGPWQVWLANTPQMESLFVGQCGHTYQFYSVARDHVGNVEAATTVPQAAILLLPNQAPVLEPITNRLMAVGQTLTLTNRASDADVGQQLTFSLAPGAPIGMAVNPTNGVLTWTPACVQGGSSNVITVLATDDGCGSLSSAQSFAVFVTECLQTGLGNTVGAAGGGGCVPVSLESSFGLTNFIFTVSVPPGRFTNFTVNALAPEVGSAMVVSLGTTQVVVTLAPQPGQLLRGPKQFAEVCFSLLPNQTSAFVRMEVQDILGLRENGTPIGNTSGQPGRTVVVSEHPLLECVHGTGGRPDLLLYARPGWTCAIEERGSVQPGVPWQEITRGAVTNLVTPLPLTGTNSAGYYRAVRLVSP